MIIQLEVCMCMCVYLNKSWQGGSYCCFGIKPHTHTFSYSLHIWSSFIPFFRSLHLLFPGFPPEAWAGRSWCVSQVQVCVTAHHTGVSLGSETTLVFTSTHLEGGGGGGGGSGEGSGGERQWRPWGGGEATWRKTRGGKYRGGGGEEYVVQDVFI